MRAVVNNIILDPNYDNILLRECDSSVAIISMVVAMIMSCSILKRIFN